MRYPVRTAILCGVAGTLSGCIVGSYWGWAAGSYLAVHREFKRHCDADRKLLAPVLASDPAFGRIVVVDFPVAGVCLAGPVASKEDYERLHAEMQRLFGEPRVGHVMQEVIVERTSTHGDRK